MVKKLIFLCLFFLPAVGMKKKHSYAKLKNPVCSLIRSLYQTKPYEYVPNQTRIDITEKNQVNAISNFDVPLYSYVYNGKDSLICAYYLSSKGDIVVLHDKKNNVSAHYEFILPLPTNKRKDFKFVSYNSDEKILLTIWGTKNLAGSVWKVHNNKLIQLGRFNGADLQLKESTENSMTIEFPESVKKVKEITFPIQKNK